MIAILLALVAAPPLPPFPTEVRPRDATTAPANASLFFLGDPAPAVESVGVAASVDGVVTGTTVDAVGCCVVRARFATDSVGGPVDGDVVTINLTSPTGDASATWTAGPDDTTAPTFVTAPSVIDHGVRNGAYVVVIGADATDDTQIGMVTATSPESGDDVVGATVDGFVLSARLPADLAPGEHCVSVVAFDVAENESAPQDVCVTVADPGEGEGEGEGEPAPGCGSSGSAAPLAFALLALLAVGRRARRAALFGLALLSATPSLAAGVTWQDGALDDVMKRARAEKKLVFVEVWAGWCAPCKKQAAEVFETADGADLTKKMIAWRVDFDAPEQRALMERWNVLSLPTILVVRPDGTEVDRIEGYDTKDAFLTEARAIAKGTDPLPTLEKKLAKAPHDAPLLLEVAHRKLVRGDPDGVRMLERVAIDDAGEPAQEALFLLGRYHSRVKRDFLVAKHVWRELYTRFPQGKYVNTAAWWYAGALHETKDTAVAAAFLDKRARAAWDPKSLEMLVDFAVEKNAGRDVAKKALDDAARANVDVAAFRAKLDAPPKS